MKSEEASVVPTTLPHRSTRMVKMKHYKETEED